MSRHRLPLAVDGVLLMAETCIVGSSRQAHIPAPGLSEFIGSSHHMICSQLVARAALDAGRNLFPGEWVGYVKPSDLGFLLGSA